MSAVAHQPVSPGNLAEIFTALSLDGQAGSRVVLDRLLPFVYDELRRTAHRHLLRERRGHLLDSTDLVNEAYLRLVDHRQVAWRNLRHFHAVACRLMREILVDLARRRRTLKRRYERTPTARPDSFLAVDEARTIDRLALDEALLDLGRHSQRQRRVVELRYLTGLSIDEAAFVLSVSAGTVRRDWCLARVFLHDRLMSRR